MLRDFSGIAEPPVARERFVQLTATRDHLRFVFMKRNLLLLAVCAAMAVAVARGGSSWVSVWVGAVVALAALVNLSTWLRLKQPEPVSYNEFLVHVLADVLLLSAALCFSGGDASPFSDLYLVPLTIAAATLPWRHVLVVAVAIVGLRELACQYYDYVPLSASAAPDQQMVGLLVAALIAYFAFCMARTSRRHERHLARIRENYLKQRHSAELGALAAAAADQLSSPLATMAVVVGELREGLGRPAERKQALDVIAKQIETCKQVSSHAVEKAVGDDPARLLLVDDDEILCSVLAPALQRRGYAVAVAHDFPSAVAAAGANRPQFAVVDLKFPGGSGLCLVRELMTLDRRMRVVVLTGYGSIATAIEAAKLGAHYYLTKPANAQDIVAALHRDGGEPSAPVGEKPLSVNRLEWEHINRVLTGNDGNVSATARLLGMHRRTLQRKLSKRPVRS